MGPVSSCVRCGLLAGFQLSSSIPKKIINTTETQTIRMKFQVLAAMALVGYAVLHATNAVPARAIHGENDELRVGMDGAPYYREVREAKDEQRVGMDGAPYYREVRGAKDELRAGMDGAPYYREVREAKDELKGSSDDDKLVDFALSGMSALLKQLLTETNAQKHRIDELEEHH